VIGLVDAVRFRQYGPRLELQVQGRANMQQQALQSGLPFQACPD